MMKIKANTKKEADLMSEWLLRCGISHTVKGFLIETPNVEESHKSEVYSVIELNTGYSLRHLTWS